MMRRYMYIYVLTPHNVYNIIRFTMNETNPSRRDVDTIYDVYIKIFL